jgi:hypothetical protein
MISTATQTATHVVFAALAFAAIFFTKDYVSARDMEAHCTLVQAFQKEANSSLQTPNLTEDGVRQLVRNELQGQLRPMQQQLTDIRRLLSTKDPARYR